MKKKCSKCGEEKESSCFYKSKNRKSGLRPQCIECEKRTYELYKKTDRAKELFRKKAERFRNSESGQRYYSEYRKSEARKKSDLEYSRKSYKNPESREKIKARLAARYAIRVGKIKKQPCKISGNKKVEAHHQD